MAADPSAMGAAARRAQGNKIRATILRLIGEKPHTSNELAAKVYLSRSGALYHIRSLERAGLITRDRPTGTSPPRWSLTPKERP